MQNMKHVCNIYRLLNIADAIHEETGQNPTTLSYSVTTEPETFFDEKRL